jgi:hypothetical protein
MNVLLRRAFVPIAFAARYWVSTMSPVPSGRPLRVAIVYVYPIVGDPEHDVLARRFVESYWACAAGADHIVHVYFNGGEPTAAHTRLFDGMPCEFHQHDDVGWDIGVYQAASHLECDMMVCLGGASYFKREGWLRRMTEVFGDRHGVGLFGASASYEQSPHIRTSAFWCRPELVRAYPEPVATYEDRYRFEHGPTSITRLSELVGVGAWMVTWDEVCAKAEWRTPANIFRRGDQSNALVRDRYFDVYDSLDAEGKALHEALADGRR